MANTITGKILYISPVQTMVSQRTGNSFNKRELILDSTRIDPYTGERGIQNTPKFEVIGDRCKDLDSYSAGQIVTITFYLQGSEYTDKNGQQQIMNRITFGGIELRSPMTQGQQTKQPYQQQQAYPQQQASGAPVYQGTQQRPQAQPQQQPVTPPWETGGNYNPNDPPF